jgi:serine/threonine protein kinase
MGAALAERETAEHALGVEDGLPSPATISGFQYRRCASSHVGQVLRGTYRILRRIDAGGMAVVYEAEQLRLRRLVAVKFVARHLAGDSGAMQRFRREAELLSRLNHPHVVSVLDFDADDQGEPYLVMELLRGETLATRLDRARMLPLGETVQIVSQVAAGLGAAHRAMIVHRDLKPPNVFLESIPGEPVIAKLLDFGISKAPVSGRRLTRDHSVIGTPEYMAPEQASGGTGSVDHRADQYSLAAITYEMLAGRTPFAGEDAVAVLVDVVTKQPRPLAEIAPWAAAVSDVVMRALAKQPGKRFGSVGDFVAELRRAAEQERVSLTSIAPPAPVATAAQTPPSRISATPWELYAHATPVDAQMAVDRARAALDEGDIAEAARRAEIAADLGKHTSDGRAAAIVELSSSLLEHIFISRLGGLQRRLFVVKAIATGDRLSLSPEQVFLLSRIDGGLSVEDTLDVAAMPRLEALRLLTGLERRSFVAVR